MKKIINTTLLIIIPLTIISCSNSDDVTEKNSEAISVQSAGPYVEKPKTVIIPAKSIDSSKVSKSTSSTESKASTMVKYTIVSGDSLSQIALNFNTTLEELIKINNINDAYKIFVDQVILIPIKNTGNVAPTTVNDDKKPQPIASSASSNSKNYTVKEGDSGYSIALAHSITLEEFAKLNDKTIDELNLLYVGDVVLVPQ
jgi:lysozyme